jgi:hypothetical protein
MKTGVLLALLGLASCGGSVTAVDSNDSGAFTNDGRSSTRSDGSAAPVDSGTPTNDGGASQQETGTDGHSDTNTTPFDSGGPNDSGLSFPQVDSSECDDSGTCVFCSDDKWHCQEGGVYPQCPASVQIGQGTNCSYDQGDFPCVVCGKNGTGLVNNCGHGPVNTSITCSQL